MQALTQIGGAAAALAAIAAAVLGVFKGGQYVLKLYRGLTVLVEDWRGEDARPGVPARAGVMQRLERLEDRAARIEAQLRPNGGRTLRDAVGRIEEQTRPAESG